MGNDPACSACVSSSCGCADSDDFSCWRSPLPPSSDAVAVLLMDAPYCDCRRFVMRVLSSVHVGALSSVPSFLVVVSISVSLVAVAGCAGICWLVIGAPPVRPISCSCFGVFLGVAVGFAVIVGRIFQSVVCDLCCCTHQKRLCDSYQSETHKSAEAQSPPQSFIAACALGTVTVVSFPSFA